MRTPPQDEPAAASAADDRRQAARARFAAAIHADRLNGRMASAFDAAGAVGFGDPAGLYPAEHEGEED